MEFPINRSDEELAISPDERLGAVVEVFPLWVRSRADRPTEFWEQQRAAILSRVSANQNSFGFSSRLAWATVAAVLAVAACLLTLNPRVPSPAHTQAQAQTDSDRDLLIEVEYAVEGEGPQALEPAAVLAGEIDRYQPASPVSHTPKEINNEE
jgi:hypothetical protein